MRHDFLKAVVFLVVLGMFTVGIKAAGIQTVKDFGAVGNGVTDDTAKIRNSISAVGYAYFSGGTYRITGSITLNSNSKIMGYGTILVDYDSGNASASNAAIYIDGNSVDVSGIVIKKNFIDGSYGSGIVTSSGLKNITIRNVEIYGYSVRYGIHILECQDFQISGCYIHDFMMNVGGPNAPDMIQDSPAGIRVTRSQRGVIANNRLVKIDVGPAGRASVSVLVPSYGPQGHQSDHMTIMQSKYININGNVMETSGEGLDLLLSQHCTVTGNVVRDIWFQCIKMLGTQYSTISGNYLSEAYQGIGLTDHDQFNQKCRGNTVTANTILDIGAPGSFGVPALGRVPYSGLFGIDMHEHVKGNIIANNVILDTQQIPTMQAAIHYSDQTNTYDNNLTAIN